MNILLTFASIFVTILTGLFPKDCLAHAKIPPSRCPDSKHDETGIPA